MAVLLAVSAVLTVRTALDDRAAHTAVATVPPAPVPDPPVAKESTKLRKLDAESGINVDNAAWQPHTFGQPDSSVDCYRASSCIEMAKSLSATNPRDAEHLLVVGCDRLYSDEACDQLLMLAINQWIATKLPPSEAAQGALDHQCMMGSPGACIAAGALQVMYGGDEFEVRWRMWTALADSLRACGLSDAYSCGLEEDLSHTPFSEAIPLLAKNKPVASKTMGTILSLSWGQLTRYDEGQPTLWVTKAPKNLPKNAIVQPFDARDLPDGIVAPHGVNTVFAVGLRYGDEERCTVCNAPGARDCVCALPPMR
jgi:hypothetical protein